nr:hypothetical protein [Bacillus cereus]
MPDGSVVRTGTNYSGKFQEVHDASKASIQSRISNLESGGVKGTGNVPKGYYQSRCKWKMASTWWGIRLGKAPIRVEK